jgi:hypothetical protein
MINYVFSGISIYFYLFLFIKHIILLKIVFVNGTKKNVEKKKLRIQKKLASKKKVRRLNVVFNYFWSLLSTNKNLR